ncbi:hypothetical protein B0J13DRAFT_525167 [Dactylonectria estremocensis]|uniref:Uncharacterized protein n=1 Tax=Dactylonectria estremocensis TaxID=1079267 RepID=A0A9P9ERG0_9HYPO|nr:hypothetical protein B0J13DRAFT_525167 [Dactylonectria estremocensis]
MKLPYTFVTLCLASTAAALPASTTSPTTAATTTSDLASTPTATSTKNSLPSTGCLRPRQSSPDEDNPPSYVPIVTAAPTQDEALASLGWEQTTYYECRTRDGTEHCGWHIPVKKKGSAAAANRGGAWGAAVAAVGAAAWMM